MYFSIIAPQVETTQLPDVTAALDAMAKIKEAAEVYYSNVGYTSETIAALSNEPRADLVLEPPPAYAEPRPLRLLCLGACDYSSVLLHIYVIC